MSLAGGRFEPIDLYTVTLTKNASGNMSGVRTLYWSTRATVKPLKESRGLEAFQTILREGYEFTFRYRSDKSVSKDMQLDYNGKTLVIHSILNVKEQNKEVQVIAMVND